jgi:hypothetical protein
MKNLFLTASLIVFSTFSVFAQDAAEESRRPEAGNVMFTFGISGLLDSPILNNNIGSTNTLLFRYYVADGLAARVGISYNRDGSTESDIVDGVQTVSKNSESGFLLSLGAQKSLGTSARIEPYIGGDLVLGRFASSGNVRSEVVNSADAGGTPAGTFTEVDFTGASTMAVGLVPAVGFNYYFAKNFAIGAEFGWGYIYSSTSGGQATFSATGVPAVTGTSDAVIKGGSFGNTGSGSIAVSVFF